MARDIEEFLRKAAERRKQQKSGNTSQPKQQPSQQKQPQQRRPPQTRSQPPQPQSQSPQPRRPGQPLPSHAPAAEPVVVLDSSAIIDEPRLTPHLKSSIDTTSISRHADALGSGISSAAAKVKENVSRHLDHNVGGIDDTETITDDPAPKIFGAKDMSMVRELRSLLANKKSVGQAIILAEILKRPDFD